MVFNLSGFTKKITMKKLLFIIFMMCFYLSGIGQTTQMKKEDSLLKELSENACNCIDSINTLNKSSVEIAVEVNKCIDDKVGGYQLGSKMMNIDLSDSISKSKKTISINFNSDKNSKEYKDYYYKFESYLMENCKALKRTVGTSSIESEKSYSDHKVALEAYNKGLEYSKTENFEKAMPFYEKAVKEDSTFAFAWDNLGICYRKMNNYDGAIYAYNKSLSIDPNGITPLQNIAVAYEYKKEYQKALKAYATLSELDSFNPEVYYGIGRVYSYYLNDPEKGLDNMCKAYNLYIKQKSPYRVDAETQISRIYVDMKKDNKTERFNEILKENGITADFK